MPQTRRMESMNMAALNFRFHWLLSSDHFLTKILTME